MSSVTALSDSLPSSVPKLDSSGTNWAIFKYRFKDSVDAKGFWGHFDGSSVKPLLTATRPATAAAAAADTTYDDQRILIRQWEKNERSSISLLTQKIPDSTLMKVYSKPTVRERWLAIGREYTQKGAYAQTELRSRFLEMKCRTGDNVRDWLDNLRTKREELTSVGVEISEKDYRSTIIGSLTPALANFASGQLSSFRLMNPTAEVDPDTLISVISEEYDRQKSQSSKRSGRHSREEPDEALTVGSSHSGGKSKRKPRGECWNCGSKDHYANKCPEPKKEKKSSSGSANVACDSDSDGGGVFIAHSISSDSDDEIPGLIDVPDSDDECIPGADESCDWFSVVDEDEYPFGRSSYSSSWDFDEIFEETASAAAVSNSQSAESMLRTELFDSGCTTHMTPYRDELENFKEIPPKLFRAANEQDFKAVGKGELVVEVPNGVDVSELKLTEVLYSPEVGYTLISIGRLDESGFKFEFGDGKCKIFSPDGEKMGEIAKLSRGLYQNVRDIGKASAATETLTLDQFHRRMGHISHDIARKLVTKGFVTGVSLETTSSGDPFFCESCIYAKATRKPVPKVIQGKRAEEFAGKVHSDLWGPALVATSTGKKYYITFTDDKTRLTRFQLLCTKDEAFKSYKEFEAWCDTQLGKKVKVFHTDRGGEYLSNEFTSYLKSQGTERQLTVHDTPQQNGIAERRNRTILERVRALLHASGLPKFLWGEAARHVIWLMNRTSTTSVDGMTPFEAVFGTKPDLSSVREWGDKVYVRVEDGNKLGG